MLPHMIVALVEGNTPPAVICTEGYTLVDITAALCRGGHPLR